MTTEPSSGAGGADTANGGQGGGDPGLGSAGAMAAAGAGDADAGSLDGGLLIPPRPPTGLPDAYGFVEYDFPEPEVDAPCSDVANASALIDKVYFAQTHVMEPSWPLFFLIADRPALLKVNVTGVGAAPRVSVEGFVDDVALGSKCLVGPAQLPAAVPASTQSFDNSFTWTLPKAWLKPGLSLKVTAGTSERVFSAEELGVTQVPDLNLLMLRMDLVNYSEGKADADQPAEFLAELAAAIPTSKTRFGIFPERVKLPVFALGAQTTIASPPALLSKRLCDTDETPGAGCANLEGVDRSLLSLTVKQLLGRLMVANGDHNLMVYLGNTEHFFAGGWGGGRSFTSGDYNGVTIHELGHALSLPHWGQGWYKPDDLRESEYSYPYGGFKDDGGGRGDSYTYAQHLGAFSSPICEDPKNAEAFGQERGDAMFRSASCLDYRNGAAGFWDGFSDFSALAMLRFMTGAEVYSGQVPYSRTTLADFNLQPQNGHPRLTVDENGERRVEGPASWNKGPFSLPAEWDVPVYTVYGSYHPEYEEATILYQPLRHQGNLPRVVDPTDEATFAELLLGSEGEFGDFFWWEKDLTFRFTFADGSVLHALYPHGNVPRDWTLGSGPYRTDLLYFAINIPADKELTAVELYRRPFMVRYENTEGNGNIRNPMSGITAQNFMNEATLIKSLVF